MADRPKNTIVLKGTSGLRGDYCPKCRKAPCDKAKPEDGHRGRD